MSVEIEVPSVMLRKEPIMETPKKLKWSYTREFLLSLSDLEVCKKLPNGFDKSLLREFEDASHGGYDRLRSVGSSSLQGFRRTDYGSSAPAKGDSVGYSRGLHRWDSRSSGRSDTDSNLEPGRRYGSLARRPGQHPEHDGLLGRPTGYAAGPSSPRFRSNNHLSHNRSNEVYQPPRPFKVVPHSRREGKDSYNDETFGTTDSTSEDRAEEEKKRRAEFELMRKEHQKVLQEKQKLNSSKIEDSLSDVTEPPVNPVDGKVSNDSDKVLKQAQQDDSSRSVSHQIHTGRPLVPPGFVNSSVEKSSVVKTLTHSKPSEVGRIELENSHQDIKNTSQDRDSCQLQRETLPSASVSGNGMSSPSVLNGSDQAKKSGLTDVSEVLDNGEILWLDPDVTGARILSESGRSASILGKFFGSASTSGGDDTSNPLEDKNAKADDNWSPNTLQSKFAGWFLEEENKTLRDTSQEKPHNLLALIAGSDKGVYEESDVTITGSILPAEAMVGAQMASKSATANLTSGISKPYPTSNPPEHKPVVLTCEDLEQSILSEVGKNTSHSQPAEPETLGGDEKAASPDTTVDNLASQHLLSLLQKGTGSKNTASTSALKEGFPDKPHDLLVEATDSIHNNVVANTEGLSSSKESLTLEALFGAAFMDELHSAQKNSVGFVRTDVKDPQSKPFLSLDGAPFPSTSNEIGSSESCSFMSNDGHGKELEFSNPPADVDLRFRGLDKGVEVQHSEEDSFIACSDHINAPTSILSHNSSSPRAALLHSSNSSINVGENLSALGAAYEDERSFIRGQDSLLFHGPHEMVNPELPYENLHPLTSSPYLHASQANYGKTLFDPLTLRDSHLDPHVKFMPPDAPIHHQFPINMGHPPLPHHNPGFDRSIPPPILQQMRMAGNLPPHLVGAFPGEAPMPPHSGHNNPASYLPERNPMQGFPFSQWRPSLGGPGVLPPGPEFGPAYNPPEAFQRLLEMELGSNPKQQVHPFAAAGGGQIHGRPIYGHEVDMGFRYI